FYLDGTGANGKQLDVQQKVADFQQVTGYNGDIHRPNYLKIVWGNLQVRRCILKSASIAYKLFQPSGVPMRAVITAVFADNSDDQTGVGIAADKSPDLTHVRMVRDGDTLPGLCTAVYGEPRHYLQVAKANAIDNFRSLEPGTRVFFPPIKART